MTSLGRADRPGNARVVRTRGESVVGSLAVRPPDRVDGGEVEHVEAHPGDGGEPCHRGPKGARLGLPLAGRVEDRTLGAGEELVPGPVQRSLPVDPEGIPGGRGQQLAQRVTGEQGADVRTGGCDQPGLRGHGGVPQRGCHTLEQRLPRRAGTLGKARGGPLEQPGPLLAHELDVEASRELDLSGVLPGGDGVAPGLDLEGPLTGRARADVRGPPVRLLAESVHGGPGAPRGPLRPTEHDVGGDGVVALAEDRGGDGEGLAHHGLGRPAPGVLDGGDVTDRDAAGGHARGAHRFDGIQPGPGGDGPQEIAVFARSEHPQQARTAAGR